MQRHTALFLAMLFGTRAFASQASFQQQPIVQASQSGFRGQGVTLAHEGYKSFPDLPQAQFWVSFLAPNTPDGREAAQKLRDKSADTPWDLLSKAAHTPVYGAALVDQAVAKAPNDAATLQAATRVLMALEAETSQMTPLKNFLQANGEKFNAGTDLLVTEAYADQMVVGTGGGGPEYGTAILSNLDRAIKLDPANVDAVLFKGRMLAYRNIADAYAFMKNEAPKFPESYPVQTRLWIATLAMPDSKSMEPGVQAAIVGMLARKKPTLVELREIYDTVHGQPEMQVAINKVIAEKYPDTGIADEALFQQAYADPPSGTPESNAKAKIAGLEAFLKRPNHPDHAVVDNAEIQLEALLAAQPNPDLAALYPLTERHSSISRGLRVLARHKYRLPDLERIATETLNQRWTMLHDYAQNTSDLAGFVDFVIDDYVHFAETSLGLIYFEEGKLDQAQNVLEQAITFSNRDAQTTTILAQVYQAKGDYPKAQSLLLEALNLPYYGEPTNPALAALPELYKVQHHGTAGLDDYMKPLLAKAREDRKRSVIADRVRGNREMPTPKFTDLQGHPIDPATLKGKILVINFWATWCGPCRAEFPDFQKFYDKYKDDKRLVVLAVSTDANETPTSSITSFAAKNKYTFPMARGGDYSEENRITTIPLTWFVNPDGRIVYSKMGGSLELMEEYTWRIEAMESTLSAAPAKAVTP